MDARRQIILMAKCHWVMFGIITSTFQAMSYSDLSDDLHWYETLKISDLGTRVKRSADPNPAQHMTEIWFSALGKSFHMYMKQSTIFSKDFQSHTLHRDGTKSPFTIDRTKFLSGKLKGDDSSSVTLHWDGHVMTASVVTHEDTYIVEPSWRHLPPSDNHTMIVYRKSDRKWNIHNYIRKGRFCEVNKKDRKMEVEYTKEKPEVARFYPGNHRGKREAYSHVGTHTVCSMAVVADYSFFLNIGRSDIRLTYSYIAILINTVTEIYKRTRWPDDQGDITNLTIEITEMIIHDSYTATKNKNVHYNMEDRPSDINRVLEMFGEAYNRQFTKVCLGHLFTYQSFKGTLGIAYVASGKAGTLGGICSPTWKNNQAVNIGISTFQNPGGSTALMDQATLTVAHGHNYGAEHDPDTEDCSPSRENDGKYIMYPSASNGLKANNKLFSPCSRRYIFEVVKRKGYDCFSEKSGVSIHLCGNGRIDDGEECDAGYHGDKCCNNKCKLIGSSLCSQMNFACCDNTTCKVSSNGKKCISSLEDFDCKKHAECKTERCENRTCSGISVLEDIHPCTCLNLEVLQRVSVVYLKKTRELDNYDKQPSGKCLDGVCQNLCQQQNKSSCICEEEENGCFKCCQNKDGKCVPLGKETHHRLQDGRPCFQGFCKNGKCEKSYGLLRRLFDMIDTLDIDQLSVFMKNNMIWVILILSTPVWIIGMAITHYWDKQLEKYDAGRRIKIIDQAHLIVLPENEGRIDQIIVRARGRNNVVLDLPISNN